jgi:hypothetical protein
VGLLNNIRLYRIVQTNGDDDDDDDGKGDLDELC